LAEEPVQAAEELLQTPAEPLQTSAEPLQTLAEPAHIPAGPTSAVSELRLIHRNGGTEPAAGARAPEVAPKEVVMLVKEGEFFLSGCSFNLSRKLHTYRGSLTLKYIWNTVSSISGRGKTRVKLPLTG
jgi:hypothetical protein